MKYIVTVKEVHSMEVPIEAATESEAKAKVRRMLASGEGVEPTTYEYSLPTSKWTVTPVSQCQCHTT